MTDQIYWSTEAQRRKYHNLPCSKCGNKIWTSSTKDGKYICIECRRKAGQVVNGREGSYTTLAAAKRQIPSFGRCKGHQSSFDQKLSNGLCEDCRFYGIPDTDEQKSNNARQSKSGHYDWVKRKISKPASSKELNTPRTQQAPRNKAR